MEPKTSPLVLERRPAWIHTYQRLLESEWDWNSLVEAEFLASTVLEASRIVISTGVIAPSREDGEIRRTYPIPAMASEDVADYLHRLNTRIPTYAVPTAKPTTPPEVELAARLFVHFVIETDISTSRRSVPRIEDPTGFYRDVRSLIFLLTAEILLPHLVEDDHGEVAANLVDSMIRYARDQWDDDAAHRSYLLASLWEALGNRSIAAELHTKALDATPTDAHDWITQVQTTVYSMLDTGRTSSAEQIVVDAIRNAAPRHLPELTELARDVFLRPVLASEAHRVEKQTLIGSHRPRSKSRRGKS